MEQCRIFFGLLLISGFLCFAGTVIAQQSQNSCQTPPCLPNEVPCAHAIGTWSSNPGAWVGPDEQFYVEATSEPNPTSPDEYAVSGTATTTYLLEPPAFCTIIFEIDSESSTITQTPGTPGLSSGETKLHWEMTHQSNNCPEYPFGERVTMIFEGEMTNNSCDRASGTITWQGLDPEECCAITFTKPADLPNGSPATETTTAVGWDPDQPTMALFKGTIAPSPASFGGKQVFEVKNPAEPTTSPNFDDCYFVGSEFARFSLSGGGWLVDFDGEYAYDHVGYFWNVVDYYRDHEEYPAVLRLAKT